MRIAVFDYKLIRANPAGSCHWRMLAALSAEHQFTVFSVEFENPDPDRIEWVPVRVPARPLALLFLAYHLVAPIEYFLYRWRRGVRFDLVQMVESNLSFGDLCYAHFCHTAYLKHHWRQTGASGLRGVLRWLDHKLHAVLERGRFRRARRIVAPSRGLAREIETEFPEARGKVTVLSNAVDVEKLQYPRGFSREAFRSGLGCGADHVVFVFAALGHFERKGLPLLLEALEQIDSPVARLWVVGGEPDLVNAYRARIAASPLRDKVAFAGMQSDVRPYLWAADAFVFPSTYETFSLVSYEAAAAGLPLLVPQLNGVEELVHNGENGIVYSRNLEDLRNALTRFLKLSAAERVEMGRNAQRAASLYDNSRFTERWRALYQTWTSCGDCSGVADGVRRDVTPAGD